MEARGVLGPAKRHAVVPPVCSAWLYPGAPPGGTCLEHLLRERSRIQPKVLPSYFGTLLLIKCSTDFTLSLSWIVMFLTRSVRECPATLRIVLPGCCVLVMNQFLSPCSNTGQLWCIVSLTLQQSLTTSMHTVTEERTNSLLRGTKPPAETGSV